MADVTQLAPDVEKYLAYPSSDTPTTEQEYQDFVRNMYSVSRDLIGTVRLWQPSTTYAVDEIIESPNMQPNTVAKVTSAGQSNNLEPTWAAAGEAVEDNGCQYVMVRKCQEAATAEEAAEGTDMMKIVTPAALASVLEEFEKSVISKAHPVGSIWETTTNDDPNTLWPGTTWVKMSAGRMLIAAGSYTESGTTYTYNLGDFGGEVKHQLTADEMPSHDHSLAFGTNNISFGFSIRSQSNNTANVLAGTNTTVTRREHNSGNAVEPSSAGSWYRDELRFSHDITPTGTMGSTGGNGRHENRPPYTVVNMWRRTS